MFQTVRTAAAVLTLAAALAGCQAGLPTVKIDAVKPGTPVAAKAAGTVRMAIAGLGQAYKVLATRRDVHTVKATLSSSGGKPQVRELGPKELSKPQVYVDFAGVAAGKAVLAVEAFDKAGKAIGKGQNGTAVVGGKTSTVHVKVTLDAAASEGNVDAIITFEERDQPEPLPADGEAAFRKADGDRDGWLSLAEYKQGWPHAWGPSIRPLPMATPTSALIAPMPPCYLEAVPAGQATTAPGEKTSPIWCPPYDQAEREFRMRDGNGDGRLSLDEFLGMIAWAMPAAAEPATK